MSSSPISPAHSSATDATAQPEADAHPSADAKASSGMPGVSPNPTLTGVLAGLPGTLRRSATSLATTRMAAGAARAAATSGVASAATIAAIRAARIAHAANAASRTMGSIGTIGKSRFPSVQAFSAAAFTKYQSLVDEGYARAERALARGRLQIPPGVSQNTVLGQFTDDYARTGMKDWLADEGIGEGLGKLIQVNRHLHDPAGTQAYRIPDIRIPGAKQIYDATLARKSWGWPQVRAFHRYSSGGTVTIVRPSQLGGSYSIIPR